MKSSRRKPIAVELPTGPDLLLAHEMNGVPCRGATGFDHGKQEA